MAGEVPALKPAQHRVGNPGGHRHRIEEVALSVKDLALGEAKSVEILPDAQGAPTLRNSGSAEAKLPSIELDPVRRALSRSLVAPTRPMAHDVPPSRPQFGRHTRRHRSGQVARMEIVPRTFTGEE
eukprot:13080765-Alexandrium_andersonii.AAC.1